MRFIDEAFITVQSGKGGPGCVSFRRERFIPRGGPDGGDGGKGGDLYLKPVSPLRTLYHFHHQKKFKAQNGHPGQGSQKTGASGQDLTLEVPVGTLVKDARTGELIADLVEVDTPFLAARGGRGGKGNSHFKSATHRTPRLAQPGEPGQSLELKLELKLLADAGLIGLPNAGKSTLIRAISGAKPKVADYPFTTLTPHLGVVEADWGEPFVVVDIPGLIQGAHEGAGLGLRFLRHIERTRILVQLIDASAIDPDDPLADFQIVTEELSQHSRTLARKPRMVVLNKMDVSGAEVGAAFFKEAASAKQIKPLLISAATGQGVNRLKSRIAKLLLESCHESGSEILL